MMRITVKRLFDVVVASLGLLVFAPVLAIVACLIRLRLGPPVLFRQKRPGLHGRVFTIFKFRTMTEAVDADGNLLPARDRLTPLGQFLRSRSVDELPELFNVLRGDMSLVGPRPLKVEYLDLYSPHEARRHEVKPGITGWAQIHGRNAISWKEKFALDVWYVNHRSLMLDLKILALTVVKVLRREGISAEGHVTMAPPFTGKKEYPDG